MRTFLAFIVLAGFMSSFSASAQTPPHRRCPLKPSPDCVSLVNSKIPRWDVSNQETQKMVQNACAGNNGSACVAYSVSALPWYNTNNTEDMLRIAKSCQLTNNSCVSYVASRLSRIDYNEMADVNEVAMACARADAQCVEQACSSRHYNCKRKEDLLSAARSCFELCYPH